MTADELVNDANQGIVGIDARLQVYGGYDQSYVGAAAVVPDWVMPDDYTRMSASHRIALADRMTALWNQYRRAAEEQL